MIAWNKEAGWAYLALRILLFFIVFVGISVCVCLHLKYFIFWTKNNRSINNFFNEYTYSLKMTNCAWLVQVNIFFSSQNCFQTRLFPWQWLFFSCERVIKFQFKFYSLWWSVYVCLNGFKKGSLTSICNSINKFTLTVQSFVHLLFIQVNIVQKKNLVVNVWLCHISRALHSNSRFQH